MSTKFSEIIPFLEIELDCILSTNGDVTLAYELTKPELFTLSASDFEALHQIWVKAIRILPPPTVLHWQDRYTQARYQADLEKEDQSFLGRASEAYFRERPYLDHRAFCFITRRFGSTKAPTSALSSLLKRSLVPEYIVRPEQIRDFVNQCSQFQRILNDSKLLTLHRLTATDISGSSDHAGIIEQYIQLCMPPVKPELRDIRFEEEMKIGNSPCVLYTLADAEHLPAQCSSNTRYERYCTDRTEFPIGFATALGPLLDVNHIYNQYIFLEDPQVTLQKMETRRRRLQSLSGHGRENGVTRDAIDQFLQEAAVRQRLPVKAHFNVFAWTDDPADVKDLKNKIGSAITRMGATPHLETVGAPQVWWAGIPGNASDFPINDTFDSFVEQAVCFLIPETNTRSSISPFGIRLGDRLSGYPLRVDISDEPWRTGKISNRNKFVLGGSGSGKTFFVLLLVHSYYVLGVHIVVIDIGGSYKGLCALVGGVYFTYSEDNPLRFNPFYLPEGEPLDTEKKESIKALLLVLWKKADEAFLRSEYVALSNALQGYYEHLSEQPDLFPCFDSFYEYLQNEFSTLLSKDRVKAKDFDMDNLLYVLRPFYRGGEYDYLLNARDRLNLLQERLIVFELDNIKDHPILFPVVTTIIMEVFISKIRKLPGIRKMILIEEAWKAIAKEGMSEYIKWAFKTVRKFYGEAVVVTQEVEDIISSPIVKQAIINNSDCKILLDLSKFQNRFDEIQALLGLTEKDKALVLSLNKDNDPTVKYKEVFISLLNGGSRVYRTEVSLEEYLTYTTEEKEKVMVQAYAKKFGSMVQGVLKLAAEIRSGAVQLLVAAALILVFLLAPAGNASAQIAEIIDMAVKKALVAADLQVQRLQTQTLVLQDAQKTLENTMEQLHLDDITGWVQRQEDLYSGYYQELWQVKNAFTTYTKVKDMIARPTQLVSDYKRATASIGRDRHFSTAELGYISTVYTGILNASIQNIQQLFLVINAFTTQMDDAGRLRVIDETSAGIDRNYTDLYQFTQDNILLSLQRSKDEQDLQTIRVLYGIE
jgi:conjugation system TraG family ATPase